MQQLQNNALRALPSEKNKGIVGSVIFHLTVMVMLFVFGFSAPPPPETEEGIIVNFGTDETGTGFIEPSPVAEATSPPPPASPQPETTDDVPLLTQQTEEAPVVKKVDPEAERKRQEQIEAEKIRREQLEAERIRREQEEAERRRIEAEQKRQAEIADRTKAALAGARNAGTNTTGEGVTGGEGNQGAPTGDVNSQNRGDISGLGSKGISYDLAGRGYQDIPIPRYDYQGEGKVVVEVSVDRSGKVTQAVAGIKGSTTLDEYLLRAAREAALKASFEPKADAPAVQKGTITYNFVLR
ncbi:MAG TPA: energy transducer TonB [Bacteroidales bacterium]|nr:energy transducer TonB [Bacteroidales bacterium]HPF03623.1 energy transducer TonB [Bacteroidales bacterium]HPJ59506.1 energy transducer TonB [Bacteroidales bacterium]HPR12889.1 energy transducer TonB [Bacteroidales bacterium]HRW85084.1 energy transducer TonB [Bacteroidales bacterium]